MTEETKPVADPLVDLRVPLSQFNYAIKSLNRNPLGADVMEVAAMIQGWTGQVQSQLDKVNAARAVAEQKVAAVAKANAKK